MKVYDEKLYEFLSKKENFEPFFDLKQQYDKVRMQLINEFWNEVAEQVKVNPSLNNEWSVMVDKPGQGSRKLRVSHPATMQNKETRAGIIHEHLDGYVYLGVWFNRWLMKDEIDIQKIFIKAADFVKDKPGWSAGSGGSWFVIYQDSEKDFRQKETLMQILPEERASVVTSMASDIVNAVNLFGDFCIEQVNQTAWKS